MKRILLLGSIESPFLFEKISELSGAPGTEFDCFDTEFCRLYHGKNISAYKSQELFLKKQAISPIRKKINILLSIPVLALLILSGRYRWINMCYISTFYLPFIPLFSFSRAKLLVTIFGSDYTYASETVKTKFMKLFDTATFIIFTNQLLLEEFNKHYKQKYKARLRVCRFGLPVLKFIDKCRLENESYKEFFRLPIGKIALVCGTYGGANNNQLKILDGLMKVKERLCRETHLVLPYIYGGDPATLTVLKNTLSNSPFTYNILTDYLSLEELAKFRLATDILIHLPTRDQFSGAMQETLYAGGAVITGSWLPYNLLDKNGAFYIKIDGFEDLPAAISDLVNHPELNPEQRHKNKNAIHQLSSWEKQKECWLNLYNS